MCHKKNNISSISLYGYALGAGNIIHVIDLLLKEDQSILERKYDISISDKKRILEALRHGKIILDVPFKSLDEVINLHGPNENLLMYKKRMTTHNILNPIDTLNMLKNLNMTFIVFFDIENKAFSTHEDSNFVKRLLDANATGTNIIIMTDNNGHLADHKTLWKIYSNLNE